jgi:putative membrane protein
MHHTYGELDNRHSVWKGAAAGLVGGLVASWVMNQFQAGLSKATAAMQEGNGQQRREPGPQQERPEPESEDATMKAAGAIAETVLHRSLTKQEKQTAGPIVHYAFGSTMGAVYGALAEVAPVTSAAFGAPFGTALWFGSDEVAVPAFGLSKPPTEYPASTHASALAAHVVYGITTDLVRRAVRAAI